MALIEVERHFDEFAISVVDAFGLMQIMPFWLDKINLPDKTLFKIKINLRMGCTILRYYLDIESGNLTRALARYNGSLGKYVYPNKVIKALNPSLGLPDNNSLKNRQLLIYWSGVGTTDLYFL